MIRAADPATLADWLQAAGTIAAVVLALFLQVFLVWARRPKPMVWYSDDAEADDDIVYFEGLDHAQYIECYVRVRVFIGRRKKTATGMRALLLQVHRPDATDGTLKVPDCLFKWSGPSFAEDNVVPPGTWRHLDVLRFRNELGQDGGPDGDPILTPALNRPGRGNTDEHWPPSARNRLTAAGWYAIDFVLSCDDGKATYWRLEFYFSLPEPESSNRTAMELCNRLQGIAVDRITAPKRKRNGKSFPLMDWTAPTDPPPPRNLRPSP